MPPYSDEAEKAVLGAVLLDNDALRVARAVVKPGHFYSEHHRRIFEAMLIMASRNTPIDYVTIGEYLKSAGDLEHCGGVQMLVGLTDSVATVTNVDHYARIISEMAARRQMIYAAQDVVAKGYMSDGDEVKEYLAASRSSIAVAANFLMGTGKGPRKIDDDIIEVHREIVSGKPPEGVVKTGFSGIDYLSGGLWPGLLHVLAARPGMGKSAVALNIANNVSQGGGRVLYVTLEDTRKLTVYRMFARYADIDLTDLTLGRVKEYDQFNRLAEATAKLGGGKPLWLDDTPGLTSEMVVQIAAAHHATHGLNLLIIDHLHEVTDTGESETVITSTATRNFRDIGKQLNIPVLLLCQLNRGVEGRSNKRPTLSDLRQSGTIEQVARFVWFLYREGYYTKETDRRDLEWDIAKATHGRVGIVKMFLYLSRMYARDWDVQLDGLWPNDEPEERSDNKKAGRGEVYGGHDNY